MQEPTRQAITEQLACGETTYP